MRRDQAGGDPAVHGGSGCAGAGLCGADEGCGSHPGDGVGRPQPVPGVVGVLQGARAGAVVRDDVGFGGWEAMGQAWKGLAQLATGTALTAIPGVGAAFWTLPDDKLPSWIRDSRTAMKETGKALVAWDEWGKNPARAAGAVTFNVLTTVFTGGAGGAAAGAGKAGAAARAISLAGKAGHFIDPMTYIAKGAGAGLSKIGDITKGLRGVGNIDIPTLPDNAIPPARRHRPPARRHRPPATTCRAAEATHCRATAPTLPRVGASWMTQAGSVTTLSTQPSMCLAVRNPVRLRVPRAPASCTTATTRTARRARSPRSRSTRSRSTAPTTTRVFRGVLQEERKPERPGPRQRERYDTAPADTGVGATPLGRSQRRA